VSIVSAEATVLDETEFIDRSDATNPVTRVLVTFQTADGRVDSVSLPKKDYSKDVRNKAIADQVKKRAARLLEKVKV